MQAPGDYVLDSAGAAVGRVERALPVASGECLVVARAFSRTGYVVCKASDVVGSETDERGLVWHTLRMGMEAVLRVGVFRREMGRLVKDLHPAPYGAAKPDPAVEADLREAFEEDSLTRDGEMETRVTHGVAVLSGWIDTVGGKVVAERIARSTPGVWDAVNRLTSDDELVGAVRRAVRGAGRISDAIQDLKVRRGAVQISLLPGAGDVAAEIAAVCAAVPAVRTVEVVPLD
ncbi:MAG: BON domain-containing protein [Chloroflexota bacterium]